MSDQVALAIVQGTVTVLTSVATLVVTVLTRRKVKHLDDTVKREHRATRAALGMPDGAPTDLLPRTPGLADWPTRDPHKER